MDVSSHPPAFLFDLDGTLVDSVYQHVLAWREALESCGIQLAVLAYSSSHRNERRITYGCVAAGNRSCRNTGAN